MKCLPRSKPSTLSKKSNLHQFYFGWPTVLGNLYIVNTRKLGLCGFDSEPDSMEGVSNSKAFDMFSLLNYWNFQ